MMSNDIALLVATLNVDGAIGEKLSPPPSERHTGLPLEETC